MFSACGTGNKDNEKKTDSTSVKKEVKVEKQKSELEKELIADGLIDIHQLDTTIKVELKYATTDNFTKCNLYGDLDKAYLQKDAAEKLVSAEKYLNEQEPGYRLIIFDAARPLKIQKKMWDTLNMPFMEKIKYISSPKQGGSHNYGVAVDLSIIDNKGKELDMGTSFDFFGELASPQSETKMLNEGKLTRQQIENRKLLRSIMSKAGFSGIPFEWWHFITCSLKSAKSKYKLIE